MSKDLKKDETSATGSEVGNNLDIVDYSNIKFICVSNKGGAGKTGVATQFLVPFLYSKNKKKVNFVTLDDVNNTAKTLCNTKIMTITEMLPRDADDMVALLKARDSYVFDIAGNKTANDIIDIVGNSEITKNIWWVIPVADGDEDAMNASSTYKNIKLASPDAKIIFALSKVLYTDEKSYQNQFFYIFGHKYLNVEFCLWEAIGVHPYFLMPSTDNYNIGKALGMTIFELASDEFLQEQREVVKAIDTQISEYFDKHGKDDEGLVFKSQKEGFSISSAKKFIAYTQSFIKPAFEIIENIIKAESQNNVLKGK